MTPVTRGRNDLWGGLIVAIGLVLAITAFAGVSLFQIAAVGFFTWLALSRKQGWAWLPAAFFGFHVAHDLLDGVGGSLFFPLMVVAAGVLMLSRDRLSKNATIGILLMLAVIGIASSNRNDPARRDPEPAATSQPEPDSSEPHSSEPHSAERGDELATLTDLDGRELVVNAGERDLLLTRSRDSQVRVTGDGGYSEELESSFVLLQVPDGEQPFEIRVPAEARVRVRTTSGDVEADLSGVALDIDTVSGDVEVELDGPHAITAQSSGDIDVQGIEDLDPSPEAVATDIVGSRVRLTSLTGAISISQT